MNQTPIMATHSRLAHAVRRHGVRCTARHVTAPLRLVDATQIWYRLRLDDTQRPRRGLGDEFVLRHGTVADAQLFEHLPGDDAVSRPTERLIEERTAKGARWWV